MGMRIEIDIAEHHYNNIMALDSVSLGRVPYKGIIMYSINAIKHGKVLEQEPKTGEWIKQNDDYFDWYECSECGYGSEGEMQYSREYDVRTNYCPHCGAKMESEA
jgi:ribosomal protein L37E